MKSKKIIWLGFAVPEEIASRLFSIDPAPAIQTHKFGWSFLRALKSAGLDLFIVSACPVQNFPLTKKILFPGGSFRQDGLEGRLIPFVNLAIIKHVSRFIGALVLIMKACKKYRPDFILIHGIHSPYLICACILKMLGQRFIVVLTDPPGVILSTDSYFIRALKAIDALLIRSLVKRADGVLGLANELITDLASGLPAHVFAGIANSSHLSAVRSHSVSKEAEGDSGKNFTIVYAGALTKKYGVDRLVHAILSIPGHEKVRLELYGRGDAEELVRQVSATDERIFYGGLVDSSALTKALITADLLVNPRPSNEFFASQSFPSKLIEYLCTGCPVLTTRIPSIPFDLRGLFYYIEDESIVGIASAITKVKDIPVARREKFGRDAQEYVIANYSESAIGSKISDFLKGLK